MAKASAQITLHYVIDIQGIYRYYLLQSSTSAKPSKPTAYPPSSSWGDVEPTYTSGSTNSLYFVDCTVFANNTFKYSEVSLSTSYEAAKEAFNKAQNAQDTADAAQGAADTAKDSADSAHKALEDKEIELKDSLNKVSDDLDDFIKTTNTNFAATDERFRVEAEGYAKLVNDTEKGLQGQITEIRTYFDFAANGLTIGQEDNPYKVRIDNDTFEMIEHGNSVMWIEDGQVYSPEVRVTKKFRMLGYDITEADVTIGEVKTKRTDWDYIGGE